jgi:signal transduction histidine kinase
VTSTPHNSDGTAARIPRSGYARAVLRAPFTKRAWVELLYCVISLPITLAATYATVLLLGGSILLSITVVGLPLMALVLVGARYLTTGIRKLAHALLGWRIEAPPKPVTKPGPIGWIRSRLSDQTAWRAVGFLLARAPVAAVAFVPTVALWVFGFVGFTMPIQQAIGLNRPSHGRHEAWLMFASVRMAQAPALTITSLLGALMLLAAPWVSRYALRLDHMLMSALLTPTATSKRVTELEQSRSHAVQDSAATVRRIERDLHDGAQARLVALGMKLSRASERLADDGDTEFDPAVARQLVDEARDDVKLAIAELRDLVRGIHPPVLDKGLAEALATLVAGSTVPTTLHVHLPERPAAPIETIVYFCAAELLTNVAHHSGAAHATVDVTMVGGIVALTVSDDGVGGASLDAGGGLAGLVERVGTVDGRIDLLSPPGGPTVVTVELPAFA